jgi:transcriptional regulator with XRE-family HTH domain
MYKNSIMSHIANELNRLLIEKKMTAAEIARATGITSAQISRWKSGIQIWVGAEDLKNLAAALTTGRGETYNKIHARLLHAHLLDECTGPGAKYIYIELQGKPVPLVLRDSADANPILPPRLQENLNTISKHISGDRNVRELIESVANLCRGKPIPQPES